MVFCPVCGTHISITSAQPGVILPHLRFEAVEPPQGPLRQMLSRTREALASAPTESERLALRRMVEMLQRFEQTASTSEEFANIVVSGVQALCTRYTQEDELTEELSKFFDGTQLYPESARGPP